VNGIHRGKRNWSRRGYAESTIALWCSAISGFYSFAQAAGWVVRNPVQAVSRPKVPIYGEAKFLALDEVRALLRAMRRDTVHDKRNYALSLMLIITGRRSSEVCQVRWCDFQQAGDRVLWLRPDLPATDADHLPASLWRAITDYLTAAGRLETIRPDDYIFTALSDNASRFPAVEHESDPEMRPLSEREVARLVKRYARLAGLDPKKVMLSTLRHTAAKLRREAGDSVSSISALLGISTASTQALLRRASDAGCQAWVRVEAMLGL
jgi:site-specific recombinase XerD